MELSLLQQYYPNKTTVKEIILTNSPNLTVFPEFIISSLFIFRLIKVLVREVILFLHFPVVILTGTSEQFSSHQHVLKAEQPLSFSAFLRHFNTFSYIHNSPDEFAKIFW